MQKARRLSRPLVGRGMKTRGVLANQGRFGIIHLWVPSIASPNAGCLSFPDTLCYLLLSTITKVSFLAPFCGGESWGSEWQISAMLTRSGRVLSFLSLLFVGVLQPSRPRRNGEWEEKGSLSTEPSILKGLDGREGNHQRCDSSSTAPCPPPILEFTCSGVKRTEEWNDCLLSAVLLSPT